jgi:predicted DNA-binding transcriptional regulator YafY
MRADRLLSILLLLQKRGRMTARELADQLEVSERTIYRDIEALGIAGIPIYAERGPGGGCSLLDGYQTRLTGLTETEVRALFLVNINAAQPLADLGLDHALDDALLKLSVALPTSQRDDAERVRRFIHLDMTGNDHCEKDNLYLHTIHEALWHERKLCLMFNVGNGTFREQLVEPYGLVSKTNAWYLVGVSDGEKQVYPLSLIASATLTNEQFARPTDFDLPGYWTNYTAQRMRATENRPARTRASQNKPISIVQNQRRQRQIQAKKTVSSSSINYQQLPGQQKKGIARPRERERNQHRPLQQKKRNILMESPSLPALKKPKMSAYAYLCCA